jgi:dipeptidyl aminopeptidase/acylaminoacyl peptidase
MPTTTAPYGAWSSPITPEAVYEQATGLADVRVDGGDVYWLERRPSEAGRQVVVRRDADGRMLEVTPADSNVRTRVHEYGGGPYLVVDGTVWYVEFTDQRLYRLDPGGDPRAVTPEPAAPATVRVADLDLTPDGRWLVAVRETHHGPTAREVVNEVVAIPADGDGEQVVLVSGHDFYASPRISPDGARLVCVAWDHPNMPWDDTELIVVDVGADPAGAPAVEAARSVAGGAGAGESLIAPAWSPDGDLHVISDRTGWWNLHRVEGGGLVNLAPIAAELGQPQWQLGGSLYGFLADGRIAVIVTDHAVERPSVLDPETGRIAPLPVAHTSCDSLTSDGTSTMFIGASPLEPAAVARVSGDDATVLHRSREVPVDAAWLPQPETISFPTSDGATAHAFFYPPTSPEHRGPEGERPPLIVTSHGGPTSHARPQLQLAVAFWTSRGFAVVDVNYRGSTGFGRAYRRALYGTWGVYDVDDCIGAAMALAERGAADPDRMVIRGGSASGYTTLCALTFHDVFAAGTSYYGVADLALLAEETHKFESRYLDQLIGPYPEAAGRYRERSPIHHADGLSCPVILLQGLEDRVVPPSQAETMVAALDDNGLPHAYVTFADEDHGFRRAENLVRSLECELSFYGQILGFEPADELTPVAISGS